MTVAFFLITLFFIVVEGAAFGVVHFTAKGDKRCGVGGLYEECVCVFSVVLHTHTHTLSVCVCVCVCLFIRTRVWSCVWTTHELCDVM